MSVQVGWIGVDLDGTLIRNNHWDDSLYLAAPIPAMSERVKRWLAEGRDVRIFTARVAPLFSPDASRMHRLQAQKSMQAIEDWCESHFGRRLRVTAVKDFAMQVLYDDRCVPVERDTGRLMMTSVPEQVEDDYKVDDSFSAEPQVVLPVPNKVSKAAPHVRTRRAEQPTQDAEYAKLFAEWQQKARKRKGWHIRRLAEAIGYPDTQVRLFDAEGYSGLDATGRYRRPSRDYVEKVAEVTGADCETVLIASGKLVRDITRLRRVSDLSPQATACPGDSADIEFYASYRELEPAHKEILKMIAEKLTEPTKER